MERLTGRDAYGDIVANEEMQIIASRGATNDDLHRIINHLAEKLCEYEDLEEQGRLLKLPCKVGDVVYQINRGANKTVIPLQVIEYRFKIVGNYIRKKICCSDDFLCKQPSIIYYAEDIGKTLFLTKSEAEAKLAKSLKHEADEERCDDILLD